MRRFASIAGLVVLVLLAPVAAVPSYDFPAPAPFAGDTWLNPYASWHGPILKVNLHAHSRAWGGLTSGADSPEHLAQAYADRGYDVLAISNYHDVTTLAAPPLTMVRAYEHGINVTKSHRLVLGTSDPIRFDFPFSTRSIRQFMISAVGRSGALVGLNHPSLQRGHGCHDVSALTGFQLFEVHNPYATSHAEWDCALTAGRLAWAVGNDDAHIARDVSIGVSWNRVQAQRSEAGVLSSLKVGRSYVVRGERGVEDVELRSLERVGEAFELQLSGPGDIEWVSDAGAVRQVDRGASVSRYVPTAADHYVRVVVHTARTEMVFNPLVRSGRWTAPEATIAWLPTVTGWGAWLAAAAAVAWLLRPRRALTLVRSRPEAEAA